MDRESFIAVKNAGIYNIIDRESLNKVKNKVTAPIREKINKILRERGFNTYHGLDIRRFTDQFPASPSPKHRLDEVVVTFLLFLANQLSQQKINRTFHSNGAWESEHAWFMLYKWVTYSIFTLIYDIRVWKSEHFLLLDDAIIDLALKGDAYALSRFALKIGVRFASDEPFPAEKHFTKFEYQNTSVFGTYYWRMLHFMAEAVALRSNNNHYDINYAKVLWKQFLTETMYRTLLCGFCKKHYKNLLDGDGYKQKILKTEDAQFPKLWYEIHNRVNKDIGKKEYSENDWKRDRNFMIRALTDSSSTR